MGFLPNIGIPELAILLVIVVLIFGPKRIPAAAKSVGKGMRNFRDSLTGKDEEPRSEIDEKAETKAETETETKAESKTEA